MPHVTFAMSVLLGGAVVNVGGAVIVPFDAKTRRKNRSQQCSGAEIQYLSCV